MVSLITAMRRWPSWQVTNLTDCDECCCTARLFSTEVRHPHHTAAPDLHWLRVPQWIEFKLAVPAFRSLHDMTLPYLARELRRVADMDSRRRLRCASTLELNIPPTRRVTVDDRAFEPLELADRRVCRLT